LTLATTALAILAALAHGTAVTSVTTRLSLRNTAALRPVAPRLRRVLAGLTIARRLASVAAFALAGRMTLAIPALDTRRTVTCTMPMLAIARCMTLAIATIATRRAIPSTMLVFAAAGGVTLAVQAIATRRTISCTMLMLAAAGGMTLAIPAIAKRRAISCAMLMLAAAGGMILAIPALTARRTVTCTMLVLAIPPGRAAITTATLVAAITARCTAARPPMCGAPSLGVLSARCCTPLMAFVALRRDVVRQILNKHLGRRSPFAARVGGNNGQLAAGQLLDVAQILALIGCTQSNGDTARTGTRRAPDPMHVALRNIRQLEVDDVSNFVDVDAARRDVRRDEHARKTLAETVEGRLTLALALVAMDRVDADTHVLDRRRDAISPTLRARENDHAAHFGILEQAREHIAFAGCGNEDHLLVDAIDRLAGASDFDANWILENLRGKLCDIVRHGGREQQRMALSRHELQDASYIAHEAHVEHTVGFVEDERTHLVEAQVALVDKIEKTTGRRDEDVDTASNGIHLRTLAHAAEDDGVRDAHMAAIGMNALADLDGELTRRRQDQCTRCTGLRAAALGGQALEQRQNERGRLASTGLSEA